MKVNPIPPQNELLSILEYNFRTGRLKWLLRSSEHFKDDKHSAEHCAAAWNAKNYGRHADCSLTSNGYRVVSIGGKRLRAHRIIMAMLGKPVVEQIDHINQDKTDNRLANLREVTHRQNNLNQSLRKNNKTGFMGVIWDKDRQKWKAEIKVNYKRVYLGRFNSLDEAINARNAAEKQYGFHENHGKIKGYYPETQSPIPPHGLGVCSL
jgi:hypothetical protein